MKYGLSLLVVVAIASADVKSNGDLVRVPFTRRTGVPTGLQCRWLTMSSQPLIDVGNVSTDAVFGVTGLSIATRCNTMAWS